MEAITINEFIKDFSSLSPSSHPLPTLPHNPAEPHILVRITHAALNHVDLLYARGLHQNNTSLVRPPFNLGLEFAGVVLASTSSPPSRFSPGDRVFGSALGAYATHVAVLETAVRRVPPGWSLRAAASLPSTLNVAHGALSRAGKVQKGETVLVHGVTGGLGCMAVQCARAMGARVLGTVGSQYKRQVAVRELGFEEGEVLVAEVEGWEARVREVSGGGVDCVMDVVGMVKGSLRCLKSGGRVLVVGYAGRGGKMEELAVNRILLKDASVIGYRYGDRNRRIPGEAEADWQRCEELIAQGHIKPILYDQRYRGLTSVPEAMQAMADRKVWGKAIIDVAPEAEEATVEARARM